MTPNSQQASAKASSRLMNTKIIAVVAITKRGVETAIEIKKALSKAGLSSTVYAPKKYKKTGVIASDLKVSDFLKDNYNKVDAIVAVMATGIIIRAVAPYLESKLTDPAVIGVDAAGKFVISLLSGHLGGANELTKIIAKGTGATAVITTATDVLGKQSVEDLAKVLHTSIQNPESLVAVNSAIVNGDNAVLVLVGNVKVPVEMISCFEIKKASGGSEALDIINQYDAGVIVTGEPLIIDKFVKPFTILKVKKMIVGLGARKESSMESIVEAVNAGLKQVNLSASRIDKFATVDIKRSSKPMIDAVKTFRVPLEFLTVEELDSFKHEDLSPDSKMVKEKIGVGGVCERAALLKAGKNSKLLLKKTKLNGVTVAIAEGE